MKHSNIPFFVSKLICLSLFFVACISFDVNAQSKEGASYESVNSARADFANALSRAMSNQSVKDFLKANLMEDMDGDEGVPYAMLYNQRVGGESTFAQILESSAGTGSEPGFFSRAILEIDPMLTLTMPELEIGGVERWNTAVTPPVAIAPAENVEEAVTLTGIDSRGAVVQFSATEEPSQLTLVVRESERLFGVDSRSLQPIGGGELPEGFPEGYTPAFSFGGNTYYFFILEELLGGGGGTTGGGGSGGGSTCQRDQKTTKDEFYRMRYNSNTSWKYAEKWWQGKHELHLAILLAMDGVNSQAFNTLNKFFSSKRKHLKDQKWIYPKLEVLHWTREVQGDLMKYVLIEKDQWDFKLKLEKTFTTKVKVGPAEISKTLKGTIEYDPKDDMLGESFIEYCDQANTPGEEYNTGHCRINVRHQ